MCNSFLRNRELHSISLGTQLPKSVIWNSAWEIGLFSHMCSIIYLYQYGPIDIHFILWGIIPKDNLLNLLHCSLCCSFGHWKFIPVFFDITLLLQGFFFFKALPFWYNKISPDSSSIFPLWGLQSVISPRSLVPFIGKEYWEPRSVLIST